MTAPKIDRIRSDFAILDVKAGRAALAAHFKDRPRLGKCPENLRVYVTVTGYLEAIWGSDDGVSREFSMAVDTVVVNAPPKKGRKP